MRFSQLLVLPLICSVLGLVAVEVFSTNNAIAGISPSRGGGVSASKVVEIVRENAPSATSVYSVSRITSSCLMGNSGAAMACSGMPTNTLSSQGASVVADYADRRTLTVTTTATDGSVAGISIPTSNLATVSANPVFNAKIVTSDSISGASYIIGLANNNIGAHAADFAPGTREDGAGMKFGGLVKPSGGNNWLCCASRPGSPDPNTVTCVDTGLAAAVNTSYAAEVSVRPGVVSCSVNGSAVVTVTDSTPVAGDTLGPLININSVDTSATKVFHIGSYYLTQDW